MGASVNGVDSVWFIGAWRSRYWWVGETDSCSAPGLKVSGGTDRSLLGVDEFEDYSVQQRVG